MMRPETTSTEPTHAAPTLPMEDLPKPSPTDPLTCVNDRYEIKACVGRGGMAYVYRARDRQCDEHVAIKILKAELSQRTRVVERLAAEAVTMKMLDHPNIVRVRDMGNDEMRGLLYVVMDWVPGGTASDALSDGPLSTETVVRWGIETLCALSAAHSRGIIHRDVKPANILVGRDGRALLTDFGVAIVPDADTETTSDGLIGTFAYMSPEQRQHSATVGPAADLYALGATLFTLCTATSAIDLSFAPDDDPRWSPVPEALLPLIRRATLRDPKQRYSDARAMARALLPLLPSQTLSEQPHLMLWLGVSAPDER